jgi:hypothetical protein
VFCFHLLELKQNQFAKALFCATASKLGESSKFDNIFFEEFILHNFQSDNYLQQQAFFNPNFMQHCIKLEQHSRNSYWRIEFSDSPFNLRS